MIIDLTVEEFKALLRGREQPVGEEGCDEDEDPVEERREHAQEQMVGPVRRHASSPAYCPHADCQDTQCVEFRAMIEREMRGRRPETDPLCYFCTKPVGDIRTARVLIEDGSVAHVGCWNGRKPGWQKVTVDEEGA